MLPSAGGVYQFPHLLSFSALRPIREAIGFQSLPTFLDGARHAIDNNKWFEHFFLNCIKMHYYQKQSTCDIYTIVFSLTKIFVTKIINICGELKIERKMQISQVLTK